MPPLRDWMSFTDLTTGPTDVSGGLAATLLGNVIHVFWINAGPTYGQLNHLTIDSNGVASAPTTVDAQAVDFCDVSVAVHKGAVNVFYSANRKPAFPEGGTLGVLRRASSTRRERSTSVTSMVTGSVHKVPSRVSSRWRAAPCPQATTCMCSTWPTEIATCQAIRTAWVRSSKTCATRRVTTTGPEVAGAPYIWFADTIDGMGGGGGKVPGDTGLSISAMLDVAGQAHVFYSLGRITGRPTGGFDLRHAEFNFVPPATQRWKLETLDGAGRTFADASGQARGRVGLGTACVLRDGELNVFYNDIDNANLRWGVKRQTFPWSFHTIDGQSDSLAGHGPRRYGRTADRISVGAKSAVRLGDQISVFYEDTDANVLRHAYKRPALPWMMEVVDGDTTVGGRVQTAVANRRRSCEAAS